MNGDNVINLNQMQSIDLRTVSPDTLADIREVKVNKSLPRDARIADFLQQIGNPYCFRCGKFVVKARFAENGASLEDCLKGILL
ncbi:hypothetical protein LJC27_04355 [Christensenellaceae bacterium OttesenSCG-928-M15]|nr:hypothetical protein [Christensenellaceae bacterium OttesenSCG-928-M15]